MVLPLVRALVRVERQQLLLPELGDPHPASAAQPELPGLGQVGAVDVAGVDERSDLVHLRM